MANNQQKLNNLADKYVESQKESLRIQEEYNAALKMSSSINKSIQADIDGQIDRRTTLGKKAKDYLDSLKSEISSLQTSDDIGKQLVSIEAEKVRIAKTYVGANRELGQVYLDALNTAQKTLNIEQQRLIITEKVSDAADKLAESMGGVFDGLNQSVKEVPILGKLLGGVGDIGTKMLKDKLADSAKKFTSNFSKGLSEGKSAMDALKGASAGLGESLAVLANPYVLIGAAILAVAAAGVVAFYKMSEAAKSFRTEIGLLNSQTGGLEKQIGRVYSQTAPLGASMDDVAKAATSFTSEFSGIETASDEVLGSMITLNKNFGVGVDEATKLNKVFQNIGGLSAEQSQMLISQTVEMAKLANVAPKQVIQDMAESSEYAYKYFQGSPEALAKAAVQAAKLGTSIAEAGKVADGLLDFENSITAELEASAILGTNLNLSQARYLAANGKVLEAQQSVIDQVANLGDLTRLNIYEQEALAKATGMPIADLVNQQRIRKQFGKLNEEELATAMQVLKTGGDITKMGKEDLKNKTAELAKQQEMQTAFDKSANQLSAIGSEFMMALMPVGKFLMDTLAVALSFLSGVWSPIAKAIGNVVNAIGKVFEPFAKIFGTTGGGMIQKTFEVIGSILSGPVVFAFELIAGVIDSIADVIGGVFKIVKGIFTLDFGLIMEGLGQGLNGILGFVYRLPIAIFDTLMDMFPKLMGKISDWFSSIGSQIKAFFADMLPDWAKRFLSGVTGTPTSDVQTTASETSGIESINDGVVQGGKVVSTNPADTIFATKTPDTFLNDKLGAILDGIGGKAGAIAGAFNGSNRIIEKLDELIVAVGGSRDVYMDKEKVSSAVVTTAEKSSQNRFGLMGA